MGIRREKLQKLVLVPYRPFRNLSLGIGGVVLVLAAGFGGFYAGSNFGLNLAGATPDEVRRLRETVRMYASQSREMRDVAAIAEHDKAIVLAATEQLRQENKNLLASISTLEAQVALYKRLLNPGASQQGLTIERFELNATPTPGRFAYKLLLTQVQSSSADIEGSVQVSLQGTQGGRPRTLPMPVGDNTFRLQYFQELAGDWTLPPGFAPASVNIVVQSRGKKAMRAEKKFKWGVTPA